MQTKIAHLTAIALAAAALFGMQNASANVGASSVSSHAGSVILERETTPGTVRDGHVAQAGGVMQEKTPASVEDKEHVAGGVILERERSPGTARDGDGHIAGTVMLENTPATIKNEDEHVASVVILENALETAKDGDNVVAIWVQ
jgi:hypothetical protein